MKNRNHPLLILFMLFSTTLAYSADWDQWRGPNRDGIASGFTPPKAYPDQLKKSWSTEVGIGHSSPVISGEVIDCLESSVTSRVKYLDKIYLWFHKNY